MVRVHSLDVSGGVQSHQSIVKPVDPGDRHMGGSKGRHDLKASLQEFGDSVDTNEAEPPEARRRDVINLDLAAGVEG